MPEKTSKWSKLRSLNSSQWLVIMQSPWVLLWTWAGLHRNGYQSTLERIDGLSGPDVPAGKQAELAKESAFALAVATRIVPWRPRCLTRSLALARLLKRRGIPYVIRIGVPGGPLMKEGNRPASFSAHAWVEHAGIVLNDRHDIASQFSAFDSGSDPT